MSSILLIDDDIHVTNVLDAGLTQFGYQVKSCNNGEEGLSMAKSMHPDIIILDTMMPKLDGYQLLWYLRDDEQTYQIPVAMLSSRNSEQDINYGLKLGARAYLSKPISMKTVLNCIQSTLNEFFLPEPIEIKN